MSTARKKNETSPVRLVAQRLSFLERAETPRVLAWGLGLLFLALAAVDVLHGRATPLAWDRIPGARAWIGFGTVILLALAAWLSRPLLSRPERYWESDGDA